MMLRYRLTALLALMLGARVSVAQSTPDSVAIWTSQLSRGTSAERADALGRLTALPPTTLPSSTQQALIAELQRLHREIAARTPWNDDATGEYYMSLVGEVAALGTTDAYRALVPAIGVSLGVGRRVARLGDEAVPALRDLIGRSYEKDIALGTLGLVSFWADSTGAPLSLAPRSQILQAFVQAYDDSTHVARLGLLMGLENAADPTLLPLARALQVKALALGDVFITNSLRSAIAALDARNRQLSLDDLMRIVQRNVQSICDGTTPSQRRGFCQSVQSRLAESVAQIGRGNMRPAQNGLASAIKDTDDARDKGSINFAEHALITGNIQEILSRIS